MATFIRKRIIRNPFYKPVEEISDRAKRYRANSKENRPSAPKQCNYCGRRKNVEVHHVDGEENNSNPGNLQWACKSCNQKIAGVMKLRGVGRRIDQNNPRRAAGSVTMGEYGAAIKVMRGEFDGDVNKAIATIHATPASVRSAYTRRTWPTRRTIYGPSGRQTEIPF